MIRNVSAMKRKRLVGIVLSLVVAICLIAGLTVTFAEGLTPTVDNSVDKSSTQVVASLLFTRSCSDDDGELLVYDSLPVKVSYSNPRNDYIESLVDAAEDKLLRLAEGIVETNPDAGIEVGEVFIDTHQESYDNRVYTWVQDDGSEGGILIGDPDAGAVRDQNRHMVVEGDYARTTVIVLELNLHYPNHVWDEGVVTKEATETEDGLMTYTCKWCDETRTEAIPKLSDEPVIIKKPVYKGDIVADGMVHQFTEFYDFSGLPQGTVIILNIDGETQYISVPDELQRLEVREPVEIPFELELPQGYIFENNAEPSHIMYCTVRVLGAADPENYTVTFNMNGHGDQIAEQTVNEGNTATKPTDPTASGYIFDGWYADATFSAKFDFNSAITADTTVYAKWTEVKTDDPTDPTDPIDPIDPTAPTNPTNPTKPADPMSPQTGDNSHLFLWVALLFISCGTLVGTAVYGKKIKYSAK